MRRALRLLGWMLLAMPVMAQTAAVKGPEYEVVSVRPSSDQSGNMMLNGKPDGFSGTGTTAKFMIMHAYELDNMDLVFGLPKWASDTRFDVETKMSPEMMEQIKTLTPKERDKQQRAMLRAMLADRFKLKAHNETKEMPAYAMTQLKSGFKLKAVDASDPEKTGAKLPNGARGGMMMFARDSLTGQMVGMNSLAQVLGSMLHRQVLDRTGVVGDYDFKLKFTPDDATAASGADASAPSLFTALEEQLGLKLQSIKADIPTVVVDHIEVPGANE